MIEHRTCDGKLIYFMSRSELESLKGYHATSGGRKGRAACPIHNGSNPTALSIDWVRGWASCWSCGDAWSIRVSDHPDAHLPGDHSSGNAPRKPVNAPVCHEPPKRDPDVLQTFPGDLRRRDVAQRRRVVALDRLGDRPSLRGSPNDRWRYSTITYGFHK